MENAEALSRVLGNEPYLWQKDLFQLFMDGLIRDSLDIPTGLGKTAVIGLWLTARALGARLPRRLVYGVDRRAVVDQATDEAESVESNLRSVLEEMPPEIAEIWRRNLGLGALESLPISTLRGQFADNRRWLQSPARSAIVVGTVDMIGSRLLFAAYGASARMRPVHAGLLGNDTLIVLDEAHLVPPFETLLRQICHFKRPYPVIPGLHMMALSATGRSRSGADVFRLSPEHKNEERVHRRLSATKSLMLHETRDPVESLADCAFELGKDGSRVVVFCNSRDKLARKVEKELRKRSDKLWKGQKTTALLVGARRVAEREKLKTDPVFGRFLVGTDTASSGIPAFLVATSAGEVGVDLDADHMVCDLVAWERMVQRLGRVNRSGREKEAVVDIFAAEPEDDAEGVGDDGKEQLAVLRAPFESELWPVQEDGRRQAGPGALAELKEIGEFRILCDKATTPAPLCPELKLPHVEAWSMTSLSDHAGRPAVEPWIRGWIKDEPQCRIVWRRVIPVRGERPDKELLKGFFEAFPPHLLETLETETYRAAELFKARAKALGGDFRDKLKTIAAVVLNVRGEFEEYLSLDQLEEESPWSGKTLVVDSRVGGLSPEGLLDPSESEMPLTIDAPEGSEEFAPAGTRLREVSADAVPDEGWSREAAWPISLDDTEEPGKEWRIEKRLDAVTDRDAARSVKEQSLEQHTDWVVDEVRRIAGALGLSKSQEEMLCACAEVHDLGKARDLWQTAMGAPIKGRPFAKTASRKANGRALNGYRHEFGSLRDAEPRLALLQDADLRSLARHLVAAHHGWARPVIEPMDPEEAPSMAAARAQEVALRFAQLQAEWGPWGLAWWESILRAADWAASGRPAAVGTSKEAMV